MIIPDSTTFDCCRGRGLHPKPQAINDMNRAIEIEHNYTRAFSQRGLCYLWLKNIKFAQLNYAHSRELTPTRFNNALRSEWCDMYQNGLNSGMMKRLEAFAALDQQHPQAYLCRGLVLWQHKDYARALIEIKQAILLEPVSWDAYFWEGIVCASLKHDEDAVSLIKKSLELGLPSILLFPLRWMEQ